MADPGSARPSDDPGFAAHRQALPGPRSFADAARQLARSHATPSKCVRFRAAPLIDENRRRLRSAYRAIADAVEAHRAITPAAQWLLDNYHVVTEHLTDLAAQLAPRDVDRLPCIRHVSPDGEAIRSVRVHALVREYCMQVDNRFEPATLESFVGAYQEVAPLMMAELWALPAFLRFVLLDELQGIAVRTVRALGARAVADDYADELLRRYEPSGGGLSAESALPIPALTEPELRHPFVVQLVERLRYRVEDGLGELGGLTRILDTLEMPVEDVVALEHRRQSQNNVSASHIITSLRAVGAADWREIFEALSLVEKTLSDLASYADVDHATRHRYRGAIAELAGRADRPESEIAARAADAARHPDPAERRSRDLGYYLIAEGRPAFERRLDLQPTRGERASRYLWRHRHAVYFASIGSLTLITLVLILALGVGPAPFLGAIAALAILGALPASELGVRLTHHALTRLFPPRTLPRLALNDGLPATGKTLVVMPVMLASEREIRAHVSRLEVHAVANADPNIEFVLLSDGLDAPAEKMPDDDFLLETAQQEMAALNQRRPAPDGRPRFHLLHRRRQWNAGEGCWMGWERKRGKLMELNRLLLGEDDTSFLLADDFHVPEHVRYIVTVDADTRLPIGAVRKLVGTALHPLNRPQWDEGQRRVTLGYGILQPRVLPLLPADEDNSIFQWVSSGPSGMDPYAGAVSDVYQDFFGEGIYTGKGLYDLATFMRAVDGRIPENSVLSHDLLEGLLSRCALVSDVELYEEFPSHSEVAAARIHRWTRGDWQLLPWLTGPPGLGLSTLGRWQLFDNLRRSLLAPASLALLVLVWCVQVASEAVFIALVLLPIIVPGVLSAVRTAFAPAPAVSWFVRARSAFLELAADAARAFVNITLLAQNAWLGIDAIGRALFRMTTRRRLLEWMTAARMKASTNYTLPAFAWPLKSSSIVVVLSTAVIIVANPPGLLHAAPWLFLWWLAPVVARGLSMPLLFHRPERLRPEQARALRAIARRTWLYFTTFVDAGSHHLPPDNLQEDPVPVVARRTSPTNIGLYLLSVLTARDFGWLGLQDCIDRLSLTLNALGRLEHYRGHLLNWYATDTGQALHPRYVSTVDSGNLAAHLLSLKEACTEPLHMPVLRQHPLSGLRDTAAHLDRSFAAASDRLRSAGAEPEDLRARAAALDAQLASTPANPVDAFRYLRNFASRVETLEDLSMALGTERGEPEAEYVVWARELRRDFDSHLRDYAQLLPEALLSLPESLRPRWDTLDRELALFDEFARYPERCLAAAAAVRTWSDAGSLAAELATGLAEAASRAATTIAALRHLHDTAHELSMGMDFRFLFDTDRSLFSIGYRVDDGVLDTSFYDLLASEARLASLVAIGRGHVPVRHWFRMGRPLTGSALAPVLLSWSGSMFEYLMPSLVVRDPDSGLLAETCRRAVRMHIRYGRSLRLPWGLSESAFNVRDQDLTYQYAGFGVPALGLRHGLARNRVVAPYATALATMYAPLEALDNYAALDRRKALGRYGYYEAVDFTAERLPQDHDCVVVRAFFAHHQGMSIVAIGNTLNGGRMQTRFHAEVSVEAAELLLQERSPHNVRISRPVAEQDAPPVATPMGTSATRFIAGTHTPLPAVHLLSNRRYALMITARGAGYSICDGRMITRWREDPTQETYGTFIYLRDADTGRVWSAGAEPVQTEPDSYEACLDEDRVKLMRVDGSVATALEVVVSPQENAELRRLTISNYGDTRLELDITSYAEIVLAPQDADVAHPAFSNLFVQTEYAHGHRALLATRRARSSEEKPYWAAHVVDAPAGTLEYETDRARFLGRNRSVREPVSIFDGRPLSNTVGSVLDPVFSLRTRIAIPGGAKAQVTFVTLLAESRDEALATVAQLTVPGTFERISTLAWTYTRAGLHHLGMNETEARLCQELATPLLYEDSQMRAVAKVLERNVLPASGLWRFGLSGDLPIAVVVCSEQEHRAFASQILRAQAYWRGRHLFVDVVLLNERAHSYSQDLQFSLEELVRVNRTLSPCPTIHGAAHVLRIGDLTAEERVLLMAAARVVLHPSQGSLAEQLLRRTEAAQPRTPRKRFDFSITAPREEPARPLPALEFHNEFGGFVDDGREYLVALEPGLHTPAPWSNIVANPAIGFLVTESGSSCTWCGNSRENQLTPWTNDAVTDPSGEALYIRDEATGRVWSPTAQPIRLPGIRYVARHGQGYSRFESTARGIESDLRLLVAPDDPVKLCALRLTNRSGERRRLSVTAYLEWVLGPNRGKTAAHVVTWRDRSGALFARNAWNEAGFAGHVAFTDLGNRQHSFTCDRREFIGRRGDPSRPAALAGPGALSNRSGASFDPCSALMTELELEPGTSDTVLWIIGQAETEDESRTLVERYRAGSVDAVWDESRRRWDELLGAIQISTPDRALDLVVNRWLLYQTIACRLWGRAGFYQSGGAFGFRDQLQDCLAVLVTSPALVREHILRASRHQFPEGDVQHWWHPPSDRGVRTHFVDDRLWLPFVTLRYLEVTGDSSLLEEETHFIDGPPLEDGAEDAYFKPTIAAEKATLYEHCARAIDRSTGTGPHGLPLFGGGDWNDGMNRVGHLGRGESTWMAWFLCAIVPGFAALADGRGDPERAARWRKFAEDIAAAAEAAAWDGAWYRRGYFDDGTPLGSSANEECRIDSIAQSWAVISGAGDPARSRTAMEAVQQYLVRPADDLLLLFTPPFDRTTQDPGYIKGYVPGLRENGGQYTHAAIWALIADALLGRRDTMAETIDIVNPVRRSETRRRAQAYRVEPYAVAADISSEPPNARRGGWTWYTGSAGWYHQAIIEYVLGIRVKGARVELAPCLPPRWPGCEVRYRANGCDYTFRYVVEGGSARIARVELDGELLSAASVPLAADGRAHLVLIFLQS